MSVHLEAGVCKKHAYFNIMVRLFSFAHEQVKIPFKSSAGYFNPPPPPLPLAVSTGKVGGSNCKGLFAFFKLVSVSELKVHIYIGLGATSQLTRPRGLEDEPMWHNTYK